MAKTETITCYRTKQAGLFAPSSAQLIQTGVQYPLDNTSRAPYDYVTITIIMYSALPISASNRVAFSEAGDIVGSDHSVGIWVNGALEELRYDLTQTYIEFQKLPSTPLYMHRIYGKLVL